LYCLGYAFVEGVAGKPANVPDIVVSVFNATVVGLADIVGSILFDIEYVS
jgi:hypothetical protein